jgi:MFS family permease
MTAAPAPTASSDTIPGSLGPNYRRLWVASGFSNLADGIFVVVLPILAARITDSPALVAGVVFVGRLPWLVFVLFAGAIADRLDRRRTMLLVSLLRIGIIAALAALALVDGLALPALYIASFALGVGETLYDTAAQSVLPAIVPRELLSRANGRLYAVELTMNQFVGPPLGGFLVVASVPLALASSALGFGLAAAGLVLLQGSFRPQRSERSSLLGDIREGLSYLWRNRLLRTLAIMVGIFNLASSATFAILVLYVVAPGPMGLTEVGYGLLLTSWAVGALAGSLIEERVESWVGRANVLFGCVVITGVATFVPALTIEVVPVAISFLIGSALGTMWNVITVSLRQRITPDHLLGRVNAGYRLFAWGTMPIGALLGGFIAEVAGPAAVFVVAGSMTLAMVVLKPLISEAAIRAAEVEAGLVPAPSSPG